MASERAMEQARSAFEVTSRKLEEQLSSQDFLTNKGLGNEVGIHIFCYDPSLELQARALFKRLKKMSELGELPCRIIERNLFDVFIDICEEKRILDAIPKQEEKRGPDGLLKQVQKIATPELFAQKLAEIDCQPGDVLLLTGVGQVYPALRAHVLLDNIQHLFGDTPIVLAYPGEYSGQTLQLFAGAETLGLQDGNYYRAFKLV